MGKSSYVSFLQIKLFAIIYYTVLYFIFGILFSSLLDYFSHKLTEDEKKNPNYFKIIADCLLGFSFIGIIFYIVRKIVKSLPFPFDNTNGFELFKLRELQGGIIISTIFFTFQHKLKDKLLFLRGKIER